MIKKKRNLSDIPKESQPYERCRLAGPSALTDTELVAVILRSGTKKHSVLELAQQVLEASPGYSGLSCLHHVTFEELCRIHGIGEVKAVQLLCIGELSKRISSSRLKERVSFSCPETIANYYMERLRHEEREVVLCMVLNTKNHFLGDFVLSTGTVNQSLLSPRELFLKALSFHAVRLVLVHNHPSGDAAPSPDDLAITKRIQQAGELLGISLLDHIIIGDGEYTSIYEYLQRSAERG